MIVLSIILLGFGVLLMYCYWKQTWSHTAKLLNEFPFIGPSMPIIGHLYLVNFNAEILWRQMRGHTKMFTETYAAWGASYASCHVVTADDAEIILSNPNYIRKGLLYQPLKYWLCCGLLTSEGSKWHHRRRMLTPAFHYNILKTNVDIYGQQSQKLIEKLKDQCNKSKSNVIPFITEATFKTICEATMGLKFEENDKIFPNYFETHHNLLTAMVEAIMSPLLHFPIILNISPLYWKIMKLIKTLRNFTAQEIKKRQDSFDVSLIEKFKNESVLKKNVAMLDLLICAQKAGQIDDEGIGEELDTFIFEGHDTTAIAISMSLMLLVHHEDIQQKIIQELDEIFEDSPRTATYDDLQNMKYLERCLKECLRLYPSVPFVTRNVDEDIPLTYHTAPAGAEIFVHIYQVHRDPKYYPEPERFDPDRFLPENIKGRHPFAYIPFSAGPRNCIGQKFAMLELKSIVSAIFRNFTLEPVNSLNDVRFTIDFVLRSTGPLNVKFKPRKGK